MESTTTPINTANISKILSKKELRIPAGIMPLKDGKIKPDPAKGEIRVFEQDGLLQFQWTNLDKNLSDDPLAIFSGEWDWVKIPSTKGRVYVLKSKCFEEEQFYFWMQSPAKEEDVENEKVINLLFDAGKFECLSKLTAGSNNAVENTNKSEITGFSNLDDQVNSANNAGANTNNNINVSGGNSGGNGKVMTNEDFIKNIASTFKNIKQKFPKLGKIVNKQNIQKVIDDSNIEDLAKLLPENQQTKQDFYNNISSPQFQQALDSLSEALNSENLMSILQSFGLDLSLANSSINGVEVFIKCLVKKYSKKE